MNYILCSIQSQLMFLFCEDVLVAYRARRKDLQWDLY